MKSLNEILAPIKKALISVTENTGHYIAADATKTHIVYSEDAEASAVHADNVKLNQAIQGTVDLYAKSKDVGMFDAVQAAFDKAGIAYRLSSVTAEGSLQSGFTHFSWIFEVA